MSAGTRYSASHPILAIRSCFNLEGYSVGVVLRFVGFGPPLQSPYVSVKRLFSLDFRDFCAQECSIFVHILPHASAHFGGTIGGIGTQKRGHRCSAK